ncbi:ribokinase [Anaerococcus sp. mt242]|uniref:ribokinase n=1 Tax=Anaerococcus sp. mt242 TaxID=2661917 RepID=UPI00193267DF|nr:ribokinase [Anaerococcus sp. mt242]MBM0046728.1 ribokinase [Anaerococcus sp. mt242]
MKIINFGSLNIDIFFRVNHIVRPGETISAQSIEKRAGGKGLNQSVALAKVFDKVYHAGSIGMDGAFLKDYLTGEGIDTRFIRESDIPTGNANIQVDDKGENSIVLYKGANFDNDKEYIDEVLSNFDKNDILILQNEINNMDYIIEKGFEKEMKLVLNPSPITDEIKNFDFNKIDLLLVNETEAKEISKCDDIEKCIDYFRENYPNLKIVITLGERGSIFVSKDSKVCQNAYKVEAVDSTGAGDTFTGFFVAEFYQNNDIKKCLEFATKASALSVTKQGASISIPTMKEVEKFNGDIL